jgi:YVTN family beta-propeller protein
MSAAPPIALVTGANSGIGLYTALGLAGRGFRVILAGRDAMRLERARRLVAERPGTLPPETALADFASLEAVRRLAEEALARHDRLDLLVNNAGLITPARQSSVDGYEMTIAVNHLAPFLLTNLLLDRLKASAPARIVTVASQSHRGARIDPANLVAPSDWTPLRAYGRSKLCNILFTHALARRLTSTGVMAACLHPGVVATGIGGGAGTLAGFGWRLVKPFLISPGKGLAAVLSVCSRRRGWLLPATLLLALLPAVPASCKDAVILNSDDDSLSVIDTATYKETSRTYIGRAPHHLMVTPDGKTLIIALSEGNELAFIDRATGVLTRRVEASDPYQIGFSPDGKWFVANSLRLDRIDIYDGKTYRLVHRLAAPRMPSHIGFSPDSGTVYVTLQGTDKLTAIDLASGEPKWTVDVGRQPAGVMVRPSGTILAAVMGRDHFVEVDPADGHIMRRVETGRGCHNFLLSPDGKTLYVSNRVAGTISVLDPATLNVTATLPAPGGPDDMALSSDGKELWATGRWRAWVDVIDRATGTLKTTVAVGRSPHGIFLY